MKPLSYYEQAGIVLPGTALLFGVVLIEPRLQALFLESGITIGGLGLFVLLAYIAGHFVAAFGNILEFLVWFPAGGKPSLWVRQPNRNFLTENQLSALEAKLNSRLDISVSLQKVEPEEWKRIFGQLYRDVLNTPSVERVTIFNGNYGLARGLTSAATVLLVLCLVMQPIEWEAWSMALVVCALVFGFRMWRFGVHFAHEVFYRFLLLPS